MLRSALLTIVTLLVLLAGHSANAAAQTPARAPITAADGLLTQRALSLTMAEAIAHGVVEQCRAIGFRVSVSVIDAAGLMKAFLRDEGTGPHTIELSREKAYAALTFHTRWNSTLEAATEHGYVLGSPMPNVEGASLLGGGVPIRIGTEAIGAVGVSGAVGGGNDELCANAGIDRVANLLR